MDQAAYVLGAAHEIYARANQTSSGSIIDPNKEGRPPAYKAIGISLAVGSGFFIGTSFVLKKVGLLKANEKYQEAAGEGYGYLKNAFWWTGMTLMILGEILNFVAYAFTDAILVTSLGAISVVISTVLSAIFLKERLSVIGKVACFLCVVGAVVIVLNAPTESSVANIQEMKYYVVAPGFLSYTGVILLGALFLALYVGPRYGKKNMFTYISICSWVGGLSVVATQGLGAAIVAQIGGQPQFNQWFLYVVLVFVIGTLLTEIIFLNKALNIFNAAMVTPTYYVYFTSTTIITSAVLFRGFKGTATEIVTVVFGFLTICSGVVLLQLSKSAKDVPDTAVFAGDLNQLQTIAEQEQPETEPKADALRGTAALLRRISNTRSKMEHEEFKRLHEEKEMERLATLSEDSQLEIYEWDGLRRRRTTVSGNRGRPFTAPSAAPALHPPLGRTRLLSDEELQEMERERPMSPRVLSSIAGTIRDRARSVLTPRPGLPHQERRDGSGSLLGPMQPAQLTEVTIPAEKHDKPTSPYHYGLAAGSHKTEYNGASVIFPAEHDHHHVQFTDVPKPSGSASTLAPPTPPIHDEQLHPARRQFSFQHVFRRNRGEGPQDQGLPSMQENPPQHGSSRGQGITERCSQAKNATEEERLGLVIGDSQSMPTLPRYDTYSDITEDEDALSTEKPEPTHGRNITNISPTRRDDGGGDGDGRSVEESTYEDNRRRWHENQARMRDDSPPIAPSYRRGNRRSTNDEAFH